MRVKEITSKYSEKLSLQTYKYSSRFWRDCVIDNNYPIHVRFYVELMNPNICRTVLYAMDLLQMSSRHGLVMILNTAFFAFEWRRIVNSKQMLTYVRGTIERFRAFGTLVRGSTVSHHVLPKKCTSRELFWTNVASVFSLVGKMVLHHMLFQNPQIDEFLWTTSL